MISIIIPVYNVEKYIEAALVSIMNQTFKDYEIILVDDGCTDKSLYIAERTLRENLFKNYLILKEANSGQGVARNFGVDNASGEWVFFMDADDLLPVYALEELVNATKQENVEVVFGKFRFSIGERIQEKKERFSLKTFNRNDIQYDFLTRKKKILVPGTLYNLEWMRRNNLKFPTIRFSEDVFFLWNMLSVVNKVVEIQGYTYYYVVRNNSTMTGAKKSKLLDAYKAYQRLNMEIQNNPDIIPEVKKWLLPRWVLGVLRIATNSMQWEEFQEFANEISYMEWCNRLNGFPDYKVKILSTLAKRNLRMYYCILSRLYPG